MKPIICLTILLLSFASFAFCEEYKSSLDYIEKTNKLWGVSECIVNMDKSITFVDRKNSGVGVYLFIRDDKGGFLDKVTLKPGESFELMDGHHAFITYKYQGIEDEKIIIEVTDKFDARSFGDDIKIEKKTVTILPYKDEDSIT